MTNDPTAKFGQVIRRDDGRCIVVFERYLAHPVNEVWDAITNPARLEAWFPGIRFDAREGASFEIWFGGDCDGPAHVSGEVTICEPPHRLQLGTMCYELSAAGDGCILRFSDTLWFGGNRSNEEITDSVLAGWHHYLDRLAESLESSEPLPERAEPDYSNVDVQGRDLVRDAPRQDGT